MDNSSEASNCSYIDDGDEHDGALHHIRFDQNHSGEKNAKVLREIDSEKVADEALFAEAENLDSQVDDTGLKTSDLESRIFWEHTEGEEAEAMSSEGKAADLSHGGQAPANKGGQTTNKAPSSPAGSLVDDLPSVVDLRIPFGGVPLAPLAKPPGLSAEGDAEQKRIFVALPKVPDFVIKGENGERIVIDDKYQAKQDMYDRFHMEQLVSQWRQHCVTGSGKHRPQVENSDGFVEGRPSDYPHFLYRSPFSPVVPGMVEQKAQPLPPHPYYGAYIPPYTIPRGREQLASGAAPSEDFYDPDTSLPRGSIHFERKEGGTTDDQKNQVVEKSSSNQSHMKHTHREESAQPGSQHQEPTSEEEQQVLSANHVDGSLKSTNFAQEADASAFHGLKMSQYWMPASARARAGDSPYGKEFRNPGVHGTSEKSVSTHQRLGILQSGSNQGRRSSLQKLEKLGTGVWKPPGEDTFQSSTNTLPAESVNQAPETWRSPANEPCSQQESPLGGGLAKVGTGVWQPQATEVKDSIPAKQTPKTLRSHTHGRSTQQGATTLGGGLAKVGAGVWQPQEVGEKDAEAPETKQKKAHSKSEIESWKGSKFTHGVDPSAEAGENYESRPKSTPKESHSGVHSKRSTHSRHSSLRDKSPGSAARKLWTAAERLPSNTRVRRHHKREAHDRREDEKLENRSHVSIGIPWSKIHSKRGESGGEDAQAKTRSSTSCRSHRDKGNFRDEKSHSASHEHEKRDAISRTSASYSGKPRKTRHKRQFSISPSSSSHTQIQDLEHGDVSTTSRHMLSNHREPSNSLHHKQSKNRSRQSSSHCTHSYEKMEQGSHRSESRISVASKTTSRRTKEETDFQDGGTRSGSGHGNRSSNAKNERLVDNVEQYQGYGASSQTGKEAFGLWATGEEVGFTPSVYKDGGESDEDDWTARLHRGSVHPLESASQAPSS